jgi:lysophospholipase L1-like esterase
MFTTLLKNTLLLSVSLLVTLAVGEGVLRAMGFRGEVEWSVSDVIKTGDAVLNYRLKPNSVSYAGDIAYKLNSLGFRDVERPYEKGSKFRILVLGDSVAFGYKVKFEDIFSQQLEQLLAERHPTREIEVLTLAMPGLNTLQEGHLLTTVGAKFDPDLLLLAYSINDAEAGVAYKPSDEQCRIQLLQVPVPCSLKTVMKQSALLYFVKDRLDQLVWKMGLGDQDDIYRSIETDYFSTLYRDDRNWAEHVAAGFQAINMFSQAKGIPAILVIFPVMYDFQEYKWSWIHKMVEDEGKKHHFYVVQLYEAFKQYPVAETRVERGDFVHPNGLGHRLAAVEVERYLYERSESLGRLLRGNGHISAQLMRGKSGTP